MLCQLPVDILLKIIEEFTVNPKSMYKTRSTLILSGWVPLTQTCRRLHAIITPLLYEKLEVYWPNGSMPSSPRVAAAEQLHRTFKATSELGKLCRQVTNAMEPTGQSVSWSYNLPLPTATDLITQLGCVEALTISSHITDDVQR